MTQCTADFELGTNGSTLNTTDPGSATAWNVRQISGAGAMIYSNTHAYGTLSGKFGVAGTSAANWMSWTSSLGTITDHYGRLYLWIDAYDSSRDIFVDCRTSGSAQACSIRIPASGKLAFANNANTEVLTTTASVSLSQWVRIEWHVIHSATVGFGEIKLFNSPDSITPTETKTSASNLNTAADCRDIRLGHCSAVGTSGLLLYLDNIVAGATSYPGPAEVDNVIVNTAVNF